MTLAELHELLIAHSGVTVRVLKNTFMPDDLRKQAPRSFFFKPFDSKLDALEGFAGIITGPLVLLAFTLESLVIGIASFLKGVADFVTNNPADFNPFEYSASNLLKAGACLLSAATSPLVNLIDALGSSYNTLYIKDYTPNSSAFPAL